MLTVARLGDIEQSLGDTTEMIEVDLGIRQKSSYDVALPNSLIEMIEFSLPPNPDYSKGIV